MGFILRGSWVNKAKTITGNRTIKSAVRSSLCFSSAADVRGWDRGLRPLVLSFRQLPEKEHYGYCTTIVQADIIGQ